MAEEARKNLRTQGKYSEKFSKNRDKRLKASPGELPPEKRSNKRNSNGCNTNTSYEDDELTVKYQENSSHSFNELDREKKAIEINTPGEHILSETKTGRSIVLYEPDFIEEPEASYYYYALNDSTEWNEKKIIIQGEEYSQPRLVSWYGPFPYSYSGVTLEPKEMPEIILKIKKDIEDYLLKQNRNVTLNSVLLNYYRHERDSVSWHSDDEMSMGVCPTIASVSLGATRKFEMKRKLKSYQEKISESEVDKFFINLTDGSLLIMDGCMQEDWQHRVPKDKHYRKGRINLTFRTVYSLDNVPSHISARKYKNSQTRSNTGHTLPGCEKNSFLVSYDEDFPSLGHSGASSSKIVNWDDEMDVENKEANHSNEQADNSQNHNPHIDSSMSSLNYEKQNEVNKNVQADILKENTIDQDEDSRELDESVTDSSLLSEDISQEHLNQIGRNDDSVQAVSHPAPSVLSNLNADAEEFRPRSLVSSPVSKACKEALASSSSMSPRVSEELTKVSASSSPTSPQVSEECKEAFVPILVSSPDREQSENGHSSLEDLFEYDINEIEWELFHDYAYKLKEKILGRIKEFRTEQNELHFLCDLMKENLPERCQRKITARMLMIAKKYKNVQGNNEFHYKNFGYSQRGRTFSSQGDHIQHRRNNKRPESRGQENFNRREEQNIRSNVTGQYSESESHFERENSNRSNSKRENFNRNNNSEGRTSRDGMNSNARQFRRGGNRRGRY